MSSFSKTQHSRSLLSPGSSGSSRLEQPLLLLLPMHTCPVKLIYLCCLSLHLCAWPGCQCRAATLSSGPSSSIQGSEQVTRKFCRMDPMGQWPTAHQHNDSHLTCALSSPWMPGGAPSDQQAFTVGVHRTAAWPSSHAFIV